METITKKQKGVLDFIESYQMSHGSSPTVREMRQNFRLKSDNSILKHVKALAEKGFLKKDTTPRGIKLLDSVRVKLEAAANMFRIPVMGTIPAGGPVFSEEHVIDYFEVGSDMLKKPDGCFALRVTGLSMIDAGILEGDFVIANRSLKARDGDIVIALVDGQNTVKRLRRKGNHVWLQAENKDYKDIEASEYLEIQGVVISLIRQY